MTSPRLRSLYPVGTLGTCEFELSLPPVSGSRGIGPRSWASPYLSRLP